MDSNGNRRFTVSAPGRVCLYGEHQDYLGMPSVVMAINLRCRIHIEEREDRKVVWTSPNLGVKYSGEFDLNNLEESEIKGQQNHLLAALILAKRAGRLPQYGWNATIDSDVPVQAGCSSSSALLVAWIASMQRLSGHITTKIELAGQAFQAEVGYFDAPGGNMDHIACAVGGSLRVDPNENEGYVKLGESSFDLVLGDSNTPKDTIGILERCKFDRMSILHKNGGNWDEIDLDSLNEVDASLVKGTLRNRDIERIASANLVEENTSIEELGALMCEHHSILRDVLKISTPKIDKMCDAAIHAGAVGAKIFGSGGGGCMIAMVPKRHGQSNVTLLAQITSSIAQIPGAISTQVKSEPGVDWGLRSNVVNPVVILAAGTSSRMKMIEGVGEVVANEVSSRPKAMLRVGPGAVPFLELLLKRIKEEGSNCVIVVVGEKDLVTKPYFSSNPIEGLDIRYAVQKTPKGRMKPLGTADALETALLSNPDLSTHSIVVCNGDNMPPDGSFGEIFKLNCGMLAYDASKLGLPDDRVSAFAVVDIDSEGYLTQIAEKPSKEKLPDFIQSDGVLRVSMNIFKMSFSEFVVALKDCPMDAVRNEKELPTAIGKWIKKNPRRMISIPFEGEFLDLTHPFDFLFVTDKLQSSTLGKSVKRKL